MVHFGCMSATLLLPPIALSDLPESTKDFILAASNTGKTPAEVIREILDDAADHAGFPATPQKVSTRESQTF